MTTPRAADLTVHVLALVKNAVEHANVTDPDRRHHLMAAHLGSITAVGHHTRVGQHLGLLGAGQWPDVHATNLGRRLYDLADLGAMPEGRANAWDDSQAQAAWSELRS